MLQVAHQLGGGLRVDVEQANFLDAQQVVERQRLELALRAVADQGHTRAVGPRQRARCDGRHGSGADGSCQRQFAQQFRHAVGDIGQHAERHHGGQAQAGVGGMAVDVLEGIGLGVCYRHQFDHAEFGMVADACLFVEVLPAQIVCVDVVGHAAQGACDALAVDDGGDVVGAQELGFYEKGCVFHGGAPKGWKQCRRLGKQCKSPTVLAFQQYFGISPTLDATMTIWTPPTAN